MGRSIVTGGGGFVGKAICKLLRARDDEVISISRNQYPELAQEGVVTLQLDLSLPFSSFPFDTLDRHFSGADVIFHTAAKVDMWGVRDEFYRQNVLATRNVIDLCKRYDIKRLIFTSSPSVVANGSDLEGVDESQPYPDKYLAAYPETKALAEREILSANSQELSTISLRPHLIWGPGDRHLVPTIIAKAGEGRLFRIGSGRNLVDTTYIEDCAQAHLQAMEALGQGIGAGKAYFISQGDPVYLWEWIEKILALEKLPSKLRPLPKKVAYSLAFMMEAAARISGKAPLFTRFLVSEMATSHYFDISAARRDLNYTPRFTVDEGLSRCFGKS